MANSDYRFIYNNDEGGISIVIPTDNCGLTLEQISKLRKLSDLKAAEYQSSIKEIRRQFAPASAA